MIEKLNSKIANSSIMNEELTRKEFMHVNCENLKDDGGMLKSTKDNNVGKNLDARC